MLLGVVSDQRTPSTSAQVWQCSKEKVVLWHLYMCYWPQAAGIIKKYKRLLKTKLAYSAQLLYRWLWALPQVVQLINNQSQCMDDSPLGHPLEAQPTHLHIQPTKQGPKVMKGNSSLLAVESMWSGVCYPRIGIGIPAQLDWVGAAEPNQLCLGSMMLCCWGSVLEKHDHHLGTGACYAQWLEMDDWEPIMLLDAVPICIQWVNTSAEWTSLELCNFMLW